MPEYRIVDFLNWKAILWPLYNLFQFDYEEVALLNRDGSKSNFRQVFGEDGSIITDSLAVGTTYNVAYKNAGTDNNATSLAQGTYSFTLTLNEADPAQGDNVGTMLIQQCN